MDGINPIHLAARFHAQSLLLIVQVLHDNDLMESMMDIFEGVDPHMGKTPLHLAINRYEACLKKYDQFTLNTSCFWGSTGSKITPIMKFHKIFVTKIMIN